MPGVAQFRNPSQEGAAEARNSPVVSCADATVAFALRPQGAELMLRSPHLVVAGSGVTYNVPRPAVAETDVLASLRSSI